MLSRFIFLFFAIIFVFASSFEIKAQEKKVSPSSTPTPTPTPPDDQDTVKVFTEEVRLPVVALDEYERFDPTLSVGDVLVLEDGVPQQVRSVQRIPANVLFLLCTGGETNPAMRTVITQATALRILSKLRPEDKVSVIQFNSRVEKLQDWTNDLKATAKVIATKMKSANGTRMSEAFNAAAAAFVDQPFGNRHIILITDGVDMPGGRPNFDDKMKALKAFESQENKTAWNNAVKKLIETQATVHIVSYTAFGREVAKKNKTGFKNSPTIGNPRANEAVAIAIDPTSPPGMNRGSVFTPTVGASINFDPAMRKLRKAYENATKTSERRLSSLAEETGAHILLPNSDEEMLAQTDTISRDIGAQYVVTYEPKRPFTSANIGEYRNINVNPRRIGLTLRSRRGYIVVPPETSRQ
jgi:VWFA-related protein